ncbi:uncharacterized protein Z518_00287 [Rhinocladiella mackenziei CBS 650.93]|uniref:Transcription factor domain-containing protein n=1 Tax=Rhinocladiella mackenziei CBS 650.93 TaxID=1442369 RepID=A0A0D2HEV8_9EURO|nr:uncharacterized protein Z518_00287 [Rhinocladiella mackenziei CBS 650.93]KIX09208.1 hypothetical protein Z518_00287 [Rhinocladiella mackenziei CBS 650.93]
MTCASTNLAMRIEIALHPSITPRKLLATKTQIFAELEYLRESSEYWSSLIWTLRMFEAVIARTRLGLTEASPNEPCEGDADTISINARVNAADAQSRQSECSNSGTCEAWDDAADLNFPVSDDVFGILPVTDNYDWLQNLFGTTDVLDPAGSL